MLQVKFLCLRCQEYLQVFLCKDGLGKPLHVFNIFKNLLIRVSLFEADIVKLLHLSSIVRVFCRIRCFSKVALLRKKWWYIWHFVVHFLKNGNLLVVLSGCKSSYREFISYFTGIAPRSCLSVGLINGDRVWNFWLWRTSRGFFFFLFSSFFGW